MLNLSWNGLGGAEEEREALALAGLVARLEALDFSNNRFSASGLLAFLRAAAAAAPIASLTRRGKHLQCIQGNVSSASMAAEHRLEETGTGGDDGEEADDGQGEEAGAAPGSSAAVAASLEAIDLGHGDACECVLCGCVARLRAMCPRPSALENIETLHRERMEEVRATRGGSEEEGGGVEGGVYSVS